MSGHSTQPPPALNEALEIVEAADAWSATVGLAAAIDLSAVLFRHRDLIKQEMLAVASRLTWQALVPDGWEHMSPGRRIDAIQAIVSEVLRVDAKTRARLAWRLNASLQALAKQRGKIRLSQAARFELLSACDERCTLCGRQFRSVERQAFLDDRPRSAVDAGVDHLDRWKPIYGTAAGWTIDIDHRIPISGPGTDDTLNLQLACHYCNLLKRERLSVFDMPPSTARGGTGRAWRFHALRLLSTSGCFSCGKRLHEAELTVARCSSAAAPTLQNLIVTCYAHDPESTTRWVALDTYEPDS